jgi:predicted Zn-ribbon and HTH transcriptional regulator
VDNGADPAHAVAAEEFRGDPVCWLNRVCPECGRFATDEDLEAAPRCPECGAELPS